MVKIITDTSALFTVEDGIHMGVDVLPLCVSIDDHQYRDLCFDTKLFLHKIKEGHVPSSSQPPIGEVLAAYEDAKEEEILNITMADGLSGTYQTACMAKQQACNASSITVLNSQTLCGPHRYLVEKAVRLRDLGKNVKEIVQELEHSIASEHSFLIPQNFDFLRRGGRLKPAAATIGGLLKLKPIMEKVEGGTRLDKFDIARTLSKAVQHIVDFMKEDGVNEYYKIFVSHADALEDARKIKEKLVSIFSECEIELLDLSPAFITQGGPQCIAIQYIAK